MADGVRLRVLSYNVRFRHADVRALGAVVRDLSPDVALLQEAPRRVRWLQRSAGLAREMGLVVAGGGLPALGNLVLTSVRVAVHESWCLRYPLTPGRHMRGAVFVRCSVGRSPFVVVGSHLSTDASERPGQATLLKKSLVEVDLPIIFGADLNETSGGAAWRTIGDGLLDAAAETGRGDTPTFSTSRPNGPIDAIFVDPRCRLLDYQVVDTPATRDASDHFPIVVDLALSVP